MRQIYEEKLDKFIFENKKIYELNNEEINQFYDDLLTECFKFHKLNCRSYGKYCDIVTDKNTQEKCSVEYKDIPLIHSSLFKLTKVMSVDEEAVNKVCTSSGTQGSMSFVYRDLITLNRFLGALRCGVEQVLNITNAFCINLGPSAEEAGDLWFSYAVSTTKKLFPAVYAVKQGVFDIEMVVNEIEKNKTKYENVVVIGAPIMCLQLIKYMEKNDICIKDCEKLFFVTAGGWKRYSGEALEKTEFVNKIKNTFVGIKESNIRDVFNMVELNTLFFECERKSKHIPPWCRVAAFNPEDMSVLPSGEAGILAYYDLSANSYPGFILTDDIGIVYEDKCTCGRTGQRVEIIRRVKSVDSRGCALKMDKNYAEGEI